MISLDDIRKRVASAPYTLRAQKARGYIRIIDCYIDLLRAMLESGLKDQPTPCIPNFIERLQDSLERGTFKPPNSEELLEDLYRARQGSHKAQEKIIRYLNLPGVIEVLGDD